MSEKDNNVSLRRIMVVSPHPDDETLGAGGSLLKFKKQGHQIFWLNITDMKIEDGWDSIKVKRRKEQIKDIIEFYNFDGFYNLSYSPTKLRSIGDGKLIDSIKRVYDKIRPDWIIIPGSYDAHSDHQEVYNSCMAASKSFRTPYIKKIITMEIVSETEYGFQKVKFEPNMFIDISEEMEDKIKALKIYDTEIQSIPFPRSIENIKALALTRGGCCNCKYAEAFHIVKEIM